MFVWNLLLTVADQRRAVENARVASCEMSRRRVEREEVEILLERLGGLPGIDAPRVVEVR